MHIEHIYMPPRQSHTYVIKIIFLMLEEIKAGEERLDTLCVHQNLPKPYAERAIGET